MKTTRRFFFSFSFLLLFNLLALLLSLLPSPSLASSSSSAFDENEASWTRGRWETAPFKLPLPFGVLRGAGKEREGKGEKKEAAAAAAAAARSPSSSPSTFFPASSLLGPLSSISLSRQLEARTRSLARDAWQLDESDAAEAAEALSCDACRAAVARGWELGAGWVALQGRAEARREAPISAAGGAPDSSNAAAATAAAASSAAAAAAAGAPPPQQQQKQPETVFLLPAQLRQRLRRGLRAWCEREGEQGKRGRAQISLGSALEGAKLVREQQKGGAGRWRRVERPLTPDTAEEAAKAVAPTTGARERLAARLSCSRLLFSPSPSTLTTPGVANEASQSPPDPPVIAALSDGLSLFASALSRAANGAEAESNTRDDEKKKDPLPRLLPPTLLPGRGPEENGRSGAPLCADFHPECAGWASLGECEANPGYMLGDDDGDDDDDVSLSNSDSDKSSTDPASSSSGRDKSSSGSMSSSSSRSSPKRSRRGFCRFSCGVCSPLPRGFPSSSSAKILAAVARLPANSHEAAQLEAESLEIKEGVLLRACYAAKPCGGRGGGERRFGRWFEDDNDSDKEEEKEVGGSNNNNNATLASTSQSPLHGRCFVAAAGWWLYEVCVGGGVRQFHAPISPRDAPAANSLGAFSNSSSKSEEQRVKWLSAPELYRGAPLREEAVDGESKVFPFVEQRYEGGDPCGESEEEEEEAAATAVKRSATLRLVCPAHALAKDVDAVPRLLIAEPRTCEYVVTLFHPEACAMVDGAAAKTAEAEAKAAAEAARVKKEKEEQEAAVAAVAAVAAAAAAAEKVAAAAAAAAAPPETAVAASDVPLPPPAAVTLPVPAAAAAAHDEL